MEKKKRPITDEAQNCQINQWETISIVFKLGKALFLQPQQSLFQSICGMTRGGVSRKQQTRTLHICFTSFSSWRCTYTCSQFRTASPGPASVPFAESGYCMCVCRQRRAVVFLMSKDYHVFLPLRCSSLYTSIHLCMFPFQTHLLCSLFLIRTIFHSPPARPPSPSDFPVWYLL